MYSSYSHQTHVRAGWSPNLVLQRVSLNLLAFVFEIDGLLPDSESYWHFLFWEIAFCFLCHFSIKLLGFFVCIFGCLQEKSFQQNHFPLFFFSPTNVLTASWGCNWHYTSTDCTYLKWDKSGQVGKLFDIGIYPWKHYHNQNNVSSNILFSKISKYWKIERLE